MSFLVLFAVVNWVNLLLLVLPPVYTYGLFRKLKGSHYTDDEIRGAEEKFAESMSLAQMGMFNLLQNDVSRGKLMINRSDFESNIHFPFRSNRFHRW